MCKKDLWESETIFSPTGKKMKPNIAITKKSALTIMPSGSVEVPEKLKFWKNYLDRSCVSKNTDGKPWL